MFHLSVSPNFIFRTGGRSVSFFHCVLDTQFDSRPEVYRDSQSAHSRKSGLLVKDQVSAIFLITVGELKGRIHSGASLSIIKWKLSYIEETTQFISTIRKSAVARYILVTETVTCPAFSYFIHNETKTEFSLGFKVSVPMPVPVSPTAGVSGEWISEGAVSVLRKCVFDGSSTDGSTFIPLYTLKTFRPRNAAVSILRGSKPIDIEEQDRTDHHDASQAEDDLDGVLVPVAPPWDILDSEGDEESQK